MSKSVAVTEKQGTGRSLTVAEYIGRQIEVCGKSQTEIAHIVGYERPNLISMIKQGITKLPITKVPAMAKALEVNPTYLLRLVLNEYIPESWAVIQELAALDLVTENERQILETLRHLTGNADPKLHTPAQKDALKRLAKALTSG